MADELDLEAIEARETAATRGPWHWEIHDYSMASLEGPDGETQHVLSHGPCRNCLTSAAAAPRPEWKFGRCTTICEADADFIAHAKTDIPALTREVRRLRGENERLAQTVRQLLPIDSEGGCRYCALGNQADEDGYHPDRDNCWHGDQMCLKHEYYDEAREALALVEKEIL